MSKYRLKFIDATPYVQHKETGVTYPYHKKRRKDPPIQAHQIGLFEDWFGIGSAPRKRWFDRELSNKSIVMEKLKEMFICPNATGAVHSLAPLPCEISQPECEPHYPWEEKATKKKKAKTMQYYDEDGYRIDGPKSDEQTKRDYLTSRARAIADEKYDEARNLFNIDVNDTPTTKDEIIRKLAAGEFTLNEHSFDDKGNLHRYFAASNTIEWFDPAKKRDTKGFEAALVAKDEMLKKTLDAVKIADPAEALKAVQAFEAWVPTGKAN